MNKSVTAKRDDHTSHELTLKYKIRTLMKRQYVDDYTCTLLLFIISALFSADLFCRQILNEILYKSVIAFLQKFRIKCIKNCTDVRNVTDEIGRNKK